MSRFLVVASALASFVSLPARAESVAILDLRFASMPPGLEDALRERVHRALVIAGYTVTEEAMVARRLREAGAPPGCFVGPCLTRLGRLLNTSRALLGGFVAQGSSYEYRLTLMETGGGSVLAQVSRRCDVCNFKEAEEAAAQLAGELHKQALVYLSLRATLNVESDPAGAEVILDGLPSGSTPFSNVLSPGPHRVEVVAKGVGSARQLLELEAGKHRTLRVPLASWATWPVVGQTAPPKKPVIPPWVKWAALGTGAALSGVGGGLIALDGGTMSDERYVHDTKAAGISLVSVGAVAVLGAVLLYFSEGAAAPAAAPATSAGR